MNLNLSKQSYMALQPTLNVMNDQITFKITDQQNIYQYIQKYLPQYDIQTQMRLQSFKYSNKKININPSSIDLPFFQAYKLYQKNLTLISQYYQKLTEWVVWTFPELQQLKLKLKDFVVLNSLICGDSNLFQQNFDEIKNQIQDENFIQNSQKLIQTSIGQKLSESERNQIKSLSLQILSLLEQKKRLFSYLENRVNLMCPNLVNLIGTRITIQLLIKTKGLENLALKSASQIENLQNLENFENLRSGEKILSGSEILRETKLNKNKILRNLSQKVAICARFDWGGGVQFQRSENRSENQQKWFTSEIQKMKMNLLGIDVDYDNIDNKQQNQNDQIDQYDKDMNGDVNGLQQQKQDDNKQEQSEGPIFLD